MSRSGLASAVAVVVLLGSGIAGALAAEAAYPFEGSWVRPDRSCSASAVRERIYTAHEVTSSRGRCTIRKIVMGSGAYELFERCDRPNERPSTISETIRMTGSDSMTLTRQTARLKLARSLRFVRCPSVATTKPAPAPAKPAH